MILQPEQITDGDEMPLTASQQQRVVDRTHACILQAAALYQRQFPFIPIRFDLGGVAAGQFRWQGLWRPCVIRYNPWVFAADFEYHFTDTVAHEVAHYLVHRLHGAHTRPHGPEWKQVMRTLGVIPKATGHYSLSGVPVRRQQRHSYRCACRTHQLSSTLHKRQQQGRRYACKLCRAPLAFSGEPGS